jgi:DNA-binding NarL/FixJ family response regulator
MALRAVARMLIDVPPRLNNESRPYGRRRPGTSRPAWNLGSPLAVRRGTTGGATLHAMGLRVLVVDDHPGFRRQARLVLEDAGYEVVGEAPDAATAIIGVRNLRPDIALVDIGLPDHDGFFVAQVLAAEAAPPAVVLVSGRDVADYGPRVRSCGARGFLSRLELSAKSLRGVLAGKVASHRRAARPDRDARRRARRSARRRHVPHRGYLLAAHPVGQAAQRPVRPPPSHARRVD